MEHRIRSRRSFSNERRHSNLGRLHYLDWLKSLAVWLVIFVHVIYYLNLVEADITKNERAVVKRMIVFFLEFGMPIFFYVSGRASFLSKTSSFKTLLKKKILRLALPLMSGYFFLLPITHYISNGRRPCSYISDRSFVGFFTYYFMYIKDFSCHGFEWLWFLALLIITSVLLFPFFKIMKDQDNKNNLPYIITSIMIVILFGPSIIYSYDFHPMTIFGLSFPLLIMLVSAIFIRKTKNKKLNVLLIYLSAISFILGSISLAFYSNIDYNSNIDVNSNSVFRANMKRLVSEKVGHSSIIPIKGFLRTVDDRRMLLAITFYISFFAVGFIDQLLNHYCCENGETPESQSLIQENANSFFIKNNYNYGIINNIPGLFKPLFIFITLILYSASFSLGNNGIGYLWSFPMYKIPSNAVVYITGSWIIVFFIDNICHTLLNEIFHPQLYYHFTASSIIFYIVHILWLEMAISYIILPFKISYTYSVIITYLLTIFACTLSYLIAAKVKFIGFITGLTTTFTSKKMVVESEQSGV